MEENREEKHIETEQASNGSRANRWLVAAVVAVLAVAAIVFGYGYRQQAVVSQLTSHQMESNATINQMQGQLNALTAKLNELSAAQAAAASPPNVPAESTAHSTAKPATARRRAPQDKRLKQIQTQLEEQQRQLKQTQDEVAKTRSDLEGSLNSTRDELNGSIAKTHEELVALEKRGERNYFEFDLTKSKQFQRYGPLMLSLRKADAKHKNYDLAMIVDDNQLSKKRVNLYEPIWIHSSDEPQPVQVVVNKVGKNYVHGYVSAPKYKESELAASTTPGVKPVSARSSETTNQNPPNNPPNQQQQPQQ